MIVVSERSYKYTILTPSYVLETRAVTNELGSQRHTCHVRGARIIPHGREYRMF